MCVYVCGRVHPHIVCMRGGLRLAWCLLPYSLRGVRQLALGTPSPPLCCSNQRQAAAQHLADMDSGDQDSGPQVCATSAFSTEPAQERRFFLKKGSLPPPAPSTPTPYSEIKMSEQEFKACKISSKVYIIISILPERIISLPLQALVPSYLFRNSGGQMCTDTSVRANWQWRALSRPLPLSGQMAL